MNQKSLLLLVSIALVWYFLKQKREEKLVEQAFPHTGLAHEEVDTKLIKQVGALYTNTDYVSRRY